MDTSQAEPAVSGIVVTTSPMLRLAVAAYLARFKGRDCTMYSIAFTIGQVTWAGPAR